MRYLSSVYLLTFHLIYCSFCSIWSQDISRALSLLSQNGELLSFTIFMWRIFFAYSIEFEANLWTLIQPFAQPLALRF